MTKKILFILTSHGIKGDTGEATGFHWEEVATPYWQFRDAGFDVDFASVKGGEPPAAPQSPRTPSWPESVIRFQNDAETMASLRESRAVANVDPSGYEAVYLPGGHGTMWDTGQSARVGEVVAQAFEQGSVVGAVCHGPAGLVSATLSNGDPLVRGRRVNSFTDSEEVAVGLKDVVPYMLESKLRQLGANFEANPENFEAYAIRDGSLVTGQNPKSSEAVGVLMLEALSELR